MRAHVLRAPAPLQAAPLYGERCVRSVANNTRADGRAFLAEAARIGVRTQVQLFPFEALPEALAALQAGVRGAAVVRVASGA